MWAKPSINDRRYDGLDLNAKQRAVARDELLWEQNEQLKKLNKSNKSNNSNYTYQYRASSTFEIKVYMILEIIGIIIFLLISQLKEAGLETIGIVMACFCGFALIASIPDYIICKINENAKNNNNQKQKR